MTRLLFTKLRTNYGLSPLIPNSRRSRRSGFADPDWLVGISLCLIVGMLILPFARREDWIGWVCIVASPILILPFVLLIVVGVYDRFRDALRASADEIGPHGEGEDTSG